MAAGLRDYDSSDGYGVNIYNPETTLLVATAYEAQAMGDQVRRLHRALTNPDPWPSLARAFPSLVEVAEYVSLPGKSKSDVQDRIVTLYASYCREWLQFEDSWAAQPLGRIS